MTAITGDIVRDTRVARKQSRKYVAGVTGLTEGKIWSIENGRAIRSDEADLLAHWIAGDGAGEPQTAQVLGSASSPAPERSEPAPASGAPDSQLANVLLEPVDVIAAVRDTAAAYKAQYEAAGETSSEVSPAVPSWADELLQRDDVRLFSNSEVQTFKRCRRKWWLGWHRGLRAKTGDSPVGPMAVGVRGHAALAQWYVTPGTPRTNPRDALERLIVRDWSALTQHHGVVPPELEKKFVSDADLERIMLEGYMEWLAETGDDADLEVIAPETVLAHDLQFVDTPDDKQAFYIGRLDARVRRKSDGAHQFIDHKFVAEFTTPARVLHLDEQMLGYQLLEEQNAPNGEKVSGALYNMLRRVRRTAKATPPFYLRMFVGHNPLELLSYRTRLYAVIRDIMNVEKGLRDTEISPLVYVYPTPTRDCAWQCPFFAVCGMFDDGSRVEAALDTYYEKGDPRDYYRREITESKNEE